MTFADCYRQPDLVSAQETYPEYPTLRIILQYFCGNTSYISEDGEQGCGILTRKHHTDKGGVSLPGFTADLWQKVSSIVSLSLHELTP